MLEPRKRDALGNATSMTVAPSSTAPTAASYSASYDTGNRLTALTSYAGALPPLHNYSYTYDQHNNRSSITADGTTTSYTYDAANELLSSQVGSATPTTYEYDANHNRLKMTSAAGTTSYQYDVSDTRLTQLTDPSGKLTTFTYDGGAPNEAGNLTSKVYDPTGANQVTAYTYDTNNRLSTVTLPNGTVVAFTYDANGNRTQKSVTPSGGSATLTNDTYQNSLLRYETNGSGTLLANFTYDGQGVPVSVRVGTDPNNSPIYYYVYNGHGDVDALTDSQGNVVASYAYDDWGNLTASSETIPNANGWTNPYRYDGHDRVRYDVETGLYWMSVRAYDPTLGRFISHDPLGRLAGMGMDTEPYVYAGNNPLVYVDPSGMRPVQMDNWSEQQVGAYTQRMQKARIYQRSHQAVCDVACQSQVAAAQKAAAAASAKSAAAQAFTLNLRVAMPAWWDHVDWGSLFWAFASLVAAGAALGLGVLLVMATATFLQGVAAIFTAISFIVQAAAFLAKAIFGEGSGLYRVLEALSFVMLAVATLMDVAVLLALASPVALPAALAEADAAVSTEAAAAGISALYTVTGVDLFALKSGWGDLLGLNK